LKSGALCADDVIMVVVALLVLLLLALVAVALLWRANHALRAGARAATEADPVTGLPGRPRFRADLDARLTGDATATLLLARLDGFAAYDAAFGHRAGDALLLRLADELRRAVCAEEIA
jgi:diguanylate cyclase